MGDIGMTPTKSRGRPIVGMNIVLSTLDDFLNKYQNTEGVVEKILGISGVTVETKGLTCQRKFADYFSKFKGYGISFEVDKGKKATTRSKVIVRFDPNVKEFDKNTVVTMPDNGIYGSFKKKVYSLLFAIWTQKEENKENEALLKMCKVLYTFNKWNDDYKDLYGLPPGKTEDHYDDYGAFDTAIFPQIEDDSAQTKSTQETKSSDTSQTVSGTMSGSKSKMNIELEVDSDQAEVIKALLQTFLLNEFQIDISSVTIDKITKDVRALSTEETNSTDKNKKLHLRF